MRDNNASQNSQTGQPVPATTEKSQAFPAPRGETPVNLRTAPLDTWHKLRFITNYLLGTLIVMLGLVVGLANVSERGQDFKLAMAVSMGMVLLGAFVLWCARARYLGGVRTLLGVVTGIIGFECLLVSFWDTLQVGRLEGAGIVVGFFLLCIGGALFYIGHGVHKDRWQYLLLKASAATDRKAVLDLQLARIKKADHYRAETHFWLGIPLVLFGFGFMAVALHRDFPFVLPGLGGLGLGIACLRCYYREYRGGLATITGVGLSFIGSLLLAVVWLMISERDTNLLVLAIALGVTLGGFFLLRIGHRLHRQRTRYLNEKLLPALKALESGAAPAGAGASVAAAAEDFARPALASSRSLKFYRVVYYVCSIAFILGGLIFTWGILRAGDGQPLLVSWPLALLSAGGVLAWWAVNGQAGNGTSLVGLLLSAFALSLLGTAMECYMAFSQVDVGIMLFGAGLGFAGLIGGLLLIATGYDLTAPPIPGVATAAPALQTQRWRPFGKYLAIGAGVLALTYLVEDARGYLAWRALRQELIGAGERLDWKDFIPPPVPDEQNFAAAPIYRQWPLIKTGMVTQTEHPLPEPPFQPGHPVTIETMRNAAKLMVNKADGKQIKADASFDEMQRLVTYEDAPLDAVMLELAKQGGFPCQLEDPPALKQILVNARFHNASPRMIFLHLLAAHKLVALKHPGEDAIRITRQANVFTVADVLAWYKTYETNLAALHAAAQRPLARLNADFDVGNWMTFPNFIRLRMTGQSLATHANACLLSGSPELALPDLQVIEKEALAAQSHPTLVGAMISVALHGLRASVIEEGMAEGAWREPQLVALQKSLAQTNLPAIALFGIEAERSRICSSIQFLSRKKLGDLLAEEILAPEKYWGQRTSVGLRLLARVVDVILQVIPRGWLYQNQCAIARHYHQQIIAAGLAGTSPRNQPPAAPASEVTDRSFLCPYKFLAARFAFNFWKGGLLAKRNQTIFDLGRVACALERYRLANRAYPAALADLAPAFIDAAPPDIMDGKPLRYRRTPNGKYLLYAVGENLADDGGESDKNRNRSEEKDWIWHGVPK